MKAVRLTIFLCSLAAFAQFPGGPFPGTGPYPGGGGRYPGNPYPNGQPQPQQRPNSGSRSSASRATSITTEGMVRRAVSGQLVIESDDHRIIWYRLNTRTAYQKEGHDADLKTFALGDRVSVDSTEDDSGIYTATEVRWLKDATAQDRAAAAETWDLPKLPSGTSANSAASSGTGSSSRASSRDDDDRPILRRKNGDSSSGGDSSAATPQTAANTPPRAANTPPAQEPENDTADLRPTTMVRPPDAPRDGDDPGPPQLRRGQPQQRPLASSIPVTNDPPQSSAAPAGPPATRPETRRAIVPQEDPIISDARDVAFNYVVSLPNFLCQQMTTRYETDNIKAGWHALDIVTADLTYQEGQESYKNIKVGGRAVNSSMEDIEGTRSTGEFATELVAVMSPETGATFKRDGQDNLHGRTAYVYKFEVPRERSRWQVEAPSQLYFPAYRGTIWIDKETSRVLRIEQEGRGMPLLFPFDTVETATDYDFVRLAANEQQYLLPTGSEVLNCQRGTSVCSRNKIEYRNYRKFGAESSIKFGDAQ
jgi:hypothetical protein